jgi:hypothetical protein
MQHASLSVNIFPNNTAQLAFMPIMTQTRDAIDEKLYSPASRTKVSNIQQE